MGYLLERLSERAPSRSFSGSYYKRVVATTFQAILREFPVTVEQIRGKRGSVAVVEARKLIIFAVREITGASWPLLATLMNRSDHSSATQAHRRIQERCEKDPTYRAEVDALLQTIARASERVAA